MNARHEHKSETLVIGVGNEFRRDDGAGSAVIRALMDDSPGHVQFLKLSGEGTQLMEAMSRAKSVLIIDAVSSGALPGTVHRFDAMKEKIPSKFFHSSTHAFSVAEAIEMARVLNQLPRTCTVFGIEGANFREGKGLSGEVERAVRSVAEEIRTLISNPVSLNDRGRYA